MNEGGLALDAQRKKIIILTAAVTAIFGISFYGSWQKNSVSEVATFNNPSSQQIMAAQSKASEPAVVYISGAVNKPGVYKNCSPA